MDLVWLLVFLVVIAVAWVLTLVNLPGNWLILIAACLFAYFMPLAGGRFDISGTAVAALAVMACVGELCEFAAGAWGTKRAGGSKRGAALAIVGSMVGALIGAGVGLPVPIVGPILGAIFFASLGALGGAMLGEHWKGRKLEESWQVGQGAFWGRMLGTLAKVTCGSAMVAIAAVAAIVA
jgi:uncharacterized protein YqgC (DUF456 family)